MMSSLKTLLIATLAYFIAGRLGLLLAIPPGFSSAVWPASGVALAALLLAPRKACLVGIGLGSFFTNLSVTSADLSNLSLANFSAPLMIGTGAMLQSLAGIGLYKALIKHNKFIDSPQEILRFYLLVTPLSCCVAPIIGVGTLYLHHYIGVENIGFSVFTWWIGDVIGVLFFTQLILASFSKQQKLSVQRRQQVAYPSIALFIIILIAFAMSSRTRHDISETEIKENGEQLYHLVGSQLRASTIAMRSISAFLKISGDVSREKFAQYIDESLSSQNGNIKLFRGIGWTEQVAAEDRLAYVAKIRAQGFPNFYFKEINELGETIPASDRAIYYPVLFIHPLENNDKAMGLDLGYKQNRLQALQRARHSHQPTTTSPVVLTQDDVDRRSLILYWPVFDTDISTKQEHFRGFLSGVLQMDIILANAIKQADRLQMGLVITDITEAAQPEMLFHSSAPALQQFRSVQHTFEYGQRQFQLNIYPTTQFKIASKDWASWSILTIGMLGAALLQAFILTLTATTERIKIEVESKTRDLNQAKEIAESANLAKTQFLANINHEIRTPLNAVTGMISLCLKTALTDQQLNYLIKAQLSLSTLLSLINQTLDYAKIEAGKMEIEQVEFSVCLLLQKVNAIFSTQASEKDIDFLIDAPKFLPTSIIGDPLRVEQILLNLCSNAIKFTKGGRVVVSLRVSTTEHTVSLEFSVQDSGIGMSQEQLDLLFQTFQQADSSMSRRYGGTGLGLAISKQLADLMGGHLSATSKMGEGSCFTFQLTLAMANTTCAECAIDTNPSDLNALSMPSKPTLATADASIESQAASLETILPLKDIRILLVEDVLLNQEIASIMLEDAGAHITTANNGIEALSHLKSHQRFDVILMDIQMPEMDGLEATTRIKSDDTLKHIPIIAMTANAATSDVAECKSVGMEGYIAKPIDEETIIQEILNHVR